jgi:hypothetical protein
MATKRERLIQRYFRSNTMKTTRASQQNTGFGTNANIMVGVLSIRMEPLM